MRKIIILTAIISLSAIADDHKYGSSYLNPEGIKERQQEEREIREIEKTNRLLERIIQKEQLKEDIEANEKLKEDILNAGDDE